MRILFLSHYFPPEVNAPASRTYDHCVRWARSGHDVAVLTCAPNCPDGVVYPGYRNRLRAQRETIDGIEVVRVWTYVSANEGTVRRIVNYVSFLLSAVLASFRIGRPDVVVATSPQFFCGWAGWLVARLKRVPFVLEIRDIWPESIAVVGALRNRALLRLLEWLERRLYRAADRIVAVGDGYRDNILAKADVGDRIDVVTNGVDLQRYVPRERDGELLAQAGLGGRFVCSYIGTLGMAHGLEVVVRAAQLLRQAGRRDVAFWLVGDGAARQSLEAQVAQAGLGDLVVFAGRLPKESMPGVLAGSDVCLVHLKKCELFETVIPSKIFEILAMERPILMGVAGPARAMVHAAGAGVDIEPENAAELAAAVVRLADDPAFARRLGAAGRAYVAERFDRDRLAQTYLDLLAEVVRPAGGGRSADAGIESVDEATVIASGRFSDSDRDETPSPFVGPLVAETIAATNGAAANSRALSLQDAEQ